MVWSITSKRSGLVLGVSDTGSPSCHGRGNHEPVPPGLNDFGGNIDHELLRRIRAAECSWSLFTSSESELHVDAGGDGLFARVQESPTASHGMFVFYDDSSDVVSCSLVAPEARFFLIHRLLEKVMLSDDLEFVISAEFLGFRVPHALTETPTWQEFIDGRPLFFQSFSFSLRASNAA